MQILNLHDCFITTNLLRSHMLHTPVEQPPPDRTLDWMVSDRARLERLWWGTMYVLVEAWGARDAVVKEFFVALDGTPRLESKLKELTDAGVLAKLRECRHYMFHRDRRSYWDDGRMAPIGHGPDMLELNRLFGGVFLQALARLRELPALEDPPITTTSS